MQPTDIIPLARTFQTEPSRTELPYPNSLPKKRDL